MVGRGLLHERGNAQRNQRITTPPPANHRELFTINKKPMSKFENIQPGDKVFVKESVQYGYRDYERFWIEKEVDRITQTLFIIGKRRFSKQTGREMGHNTYGSWARVEGECPDLWRPKEIVIDQSTEMKAFQDRVRLEAAVNSAIAGLPNRIPSLEIEPDQLEKAIEMLSELTDILTRNK